jgi:hypothetical protein
VDFHAILEIPKGTSIPSSNSFPSWRAARSDRDRKVIICRALSELPVVLRRSARNPQDRVAILREAFRKTYRTRNFYASTKSLPATGVASPPEDHEDDQEILASLRSSAVQENCRRRASAAAVEKREISHGNKNHDADSMLRAFNSAGLAT